MGKNRKADRRNLGEELSLRRYIQGRKREEKEEEIGKRERI